MSSPFPVGTLVQLTDATKAAARTMDTCMRQLGEIYPEIGDWNYDAFLFIGRSDVNGVFLVEATKVSIRQLGLELVRLKPHKGNCREEWWVPTAVFRKYQEDWLEDMDLASLTT